MASQNPALENIPGLLGYLSLNDDGFIVAVSAVCMEKFVGKREFRFRAPEICKTTRRVAICSAELSRCWR